MNAAPPAAAAAVIILNWNNCHATLACLESVSALNYRTTNVILVDNGSTDDSLSRISRRFPSVQIVETGENLGYAGGNNVGLRRAIEAGAEWILVLNNDVTLAPDCLSQLVAAAEARPMGGAFGPLIYQADTQQEIQAAGGFFTDGLRYTWRGMGETETGQFDRLCPVDLLPGSALLLSRDVLKTVGLFDERFFLYREDVDLCIRISDAGYGLYLVPSARVWHERPGLGTHVRPHVVYYMARNSLLLAQKHHMPLESLRFLWQDLTAWTLWKLSPRWRGMARQAAARADGVRDFFLGRFGRSAKWAPDHRSSSHD